MKERLLGSYLIRFSTTGQREPTIRLQDIRTGQQLEFETWTSAWAFLEKHWADAQAPPSTSC